ncbi:MAG: hypothetical protein LBR98_07150 [Syntrophomonadaceae bacterium]|jgi:hypothetical protein|nr:hypothetical protein [Syntrophomonadaceae bacterium]
MMAKNHSKIERRAAMQNKPMFIFSPEDDEAANAEKNRTHFGIHRRQH